MHVLRPDPDDEKAIAIILLCWIVVLSGVVGYLIIVGA